MEKLVYLIWPREEGAPGKFRDSLLNKVAPRLRNLDASRIAVNVQDEDVAEGVSAVKIAESVLKDLQGIDFTFSADKPSDTVPGSTLSAMISFWMNNSDDRRLCEEALLEVSSRIVGFLVVESVPLVNTDHVAPVGQRTPGFNSVSCISRRKDIPYEEFLRIWQDEHKVVASETQTRFEYIRNTVVRALTPDAPPWDAIVEEGFPIEALTNPKVFYNAGDSDEVLARNLKRMLDSCNRFLDFGPYAGAPMSQYILG